jgi:hypothetical protein
MAWTMLETQESTVLWDLTKASRTFETCMGTQLEKGGSLYLSRLYIYVLVPSLSSMYLNRILSHKKSIPCLYIEQTVTNIACLWTGQRNFGELAEI